MSKPLHDEIEAAYRKRVRASVKASLRWIAYDFKKKNRLELLAQSTLTDAETVEILERQNYWCALTGLEFWSGSKGSFKPRSPSKDRIKADGPYTADNVRIVLYGVNALRGNGTDDEMYEVAAALIAQRKATSNWNGHHPQLAQIISAIWRIGATSSMTLSAGVVLLGAVAARLPILDVACNRCTRRGRLRTDRLLAEHGPGMPMPELRRIIAADCPCMIAGQLHDVYGARFPDLIRLG